MNNVICKANIKMKVWKLYYVIMSLLIIVIALLFIPIFTKSWGGYSTDYYNILGVRIATSGMYDSELDWYLDSNLKWWLLLLVPAVIMIFGIIRNKYVSKRCTLELTDEGVNGLRKKLFSSKELRLSIHKVDNLEIKRGVMDKLFGGKTIAIRTASGVIKFPWVHNADEFVDITLAKIEEYKQTMKDDNQALISAVASNSGGSVADKLRDLKGLYYGGIITQEDFERKKKELIDKM